MNMLTHNLIKHMLKKHILIPLYVSYVSILTKPVTFKLAFNKEKNTDGNC